MTIQDNQTINLLTEIRDLLAAKDTSDRDHDKMKELLKEILTQQEQSTQALYTIANKMKDQHKPAKPTKPVHRKLA